MVEKSYCIKNISKENLFSLREQCLNTVAMVIALEGIKFLMTWCYCTETKQGCRYIRLSLSLKILLAGGAASVRAVWSFAVHRIQTPQVQWQEVSGIAVATRAPILDCRGEKAAVKMPGGSHSLPLSSCCAATAAKISSSI